MICRIIRCQDDAVSVVSVPSARGPIEAAYCDVHTLAALRAGATMTDREPDELSPVPEPETTGEPLPIVAPVPTPLCHFPGCHRLRVKARFCSTCQGRAFKLFGSSAGVTDAQVADMPRLWAESLAANEAARRAPKKAVAAPVVASPCADVAKVPLAYITPIPVSLGSDWFTVWSGMLADLALPAGSKIEDAQQAVLRLIGAREATIAALVEAGHVSVDQVRAATEDRDTAQEDVLILTTELAHARKQIEELAYAAGSWHKANGAGYARGVEEAAVHRRLQDEEIIQLRAQLDKANAQIVCDVRPAPVADLRDLRPVPVVGERRPYKDSLNGRGVAVALDRISRSQDVAGHVAVIRALLGIAST